MTQPTRVSGQPRRRHAALCLATLLPLMLLVLPLASRAEMTIGIMGTTLSLPIDVAQGQGFFAAEGVAVRVIDCKGGKGCMKMLFDRTVQLAAVTELPVVAASFERNDFAVVATLGTSAGNIRLVGRKGAGIAKAADLAGKRIGVIVGSSSHYYLDAYLLFHGIDPQSIELVPLTADGLVGALLKRQVDAMSGYTFHTSSALKALGADGTLLDAPRLYSETYNLVADKRTIAQQPAEIHKVLRALDRAERFIAERPDIAKQMLTGRQMLERSVVDAIFPSLTFRLSLEQSLITAMEGEARWAIREGHAGVGRKRPNYLDFVDPGPLRAAVPAALSK